MMYSLIGKLMKYIYEKQMLADQEFRFVIDFSFCVFKFFFIKNMGFTVSICLSSKEDIPYEVMM